MIVVIGANCVYLFIYVYIYKCELLNVSYISVTFFKIMDLLL
jgi:hypothetical protein